MIAVGALAAYGNSFGGAMVLDDVRHIVGHERIHQLWPIGPVLSGKRPVTDFTLAVNWANGEENVTGYHAVNLVIHFAAALLLFGIVRRSLESRRVCYATTRACWLAGIVGLIFVVHPLQTQSVTYIIQRCESMMGFFFLGTLYCVIRGTNSTKSITWYCSSVLLCALGMGCKAVIVTAAPVILAYDRIFLARGWGEIIRRRWWLYVAFASTGLLLLVFGAIQGIVDPTPQHNTTMGLGYKGTTPVGYLLTQFGVLLYYLRLSLWPHPLCIDYDWPFASSLMTWIPQMLVILSLVWLTCWALLRRPGLGFLGIWFFLILAPTSSVLPIKDALFEHRMYLPLAAIIVGVVLGADVVLRRLVTRRNLGHSSHQTWAVALATLTVVALIVTTARRNTAYASQTSMWKDVVSKRPDNDRAHYNLGTFFLHEKRPKKAADSLRKSLAINPEQAAAEYNLGKALAQQGMHHEAIEHYEKALALNSNFHEAYNNLGNAHIRLGNVATGLRNLEESLWIDPTYTEAHYNLGTTLVSIGRFEEGITHLHTARELEPNTPRVLIGLVKAYVSFGDALAAAKQLDRAKVVFETALRLDPNNAYARKALDALSGATSQSE